MKNLRLPWFTLLLPTALMIPAACSTATDPKEGSSPPLEFSEGEANYGDDSIGYKFSAEHRDAQAAEAEGNLQNSLAGGGQFATASGGSSGSDSSLPEVSAGGQGGGSALSSALPREIDGTAPLLIELPETRVKENAFVESDEEDTSTFSIDVDSGSFTLARGAIHSGFFPDPESVRIEEFLNYFHFHYKQPEGDKPLSLYSEWGKAPWNKDRKLLMLGVQGQEISLEEQPPLNLVYLLDVSGSMSSPEKLPLLKKGFRLLTTMLRPEDRVSIVTYAGSDRVVLEGASGDEQASILTAIDDLQSGGSTNGAGGIQAAYDLAEQHFIKGGTNRVLLATDGDFNVGLSSEAELVDFIASKRDTGVFLSVYGYGQSWDGGNYQDSIAEQLADNGNGIYFFIDGEEETRRAFGHAMSGSLMTVAKDVKLQVQFNPEHVKAYRLIGYENRVLANSDFNNDAVDAGELGAGLSVTALYEIIVADSKESVPEPLSGTENLVESETEAGEEQDPITLLASEMAQVRLRYKESDAEESQAMRISIGEQSESPVPSLKFLFAAGVCEFASQLRGSQYLDNSRRNLLIEQVERALPLDKEGAVKEVGGLLRKAQSL